MISLSFVFNTNNFISGIANSQLSSINGQQLRIVGDADSLPEAQFYLVTLTGVAGGPVTATIPFAPVAYVDLATTLGLSAEGKYGISVQALDAALLPVGQEVADFRVGDDFTAVRIEAEDAALGANIGASTGTAGPQIVDDQGNGTATNPAQIDNASGHGFVDFGGVGSNFNIGGGEWVEWTINAPEAGAYDIAFGYAFLSTVNNRNMRLDVNGDLFDRIFDFRATAGNEVYQEATTRVALQAGENTIRLTSNGFSGPNVDYLEVRPIDPAVFVVQAEDLIISAGNKAIGPTTLSYDPTKGPSPDTYRFGAEKGAYLDWGGANETASFTYDAPGAGTYEVRITYAHGGAAARPLDLLGNGGTTLATYSFARTNGATQIPRALPDDLSDLSQPPKVVAVSTTNALLAAGWEGWSVESRTIELTEAGPTLLQLASQSRTTGPNIDKIEIILVSLDAAAPTAISLQNDSILENAEGAIIGALLVTDADGGPHTFTVDDARFEVSGTGALKLKDGVSLNHEVAGSLTVGVTATDSTGSVTQNVTFLVGDLNEAPTLVAGATLAAITTQFGTARTVDLGVLDAADQDAGQTPTYAARLVGGAPLPSGVTVLNDTLEISVEAAQGDYAIEVFATDGTLESAAISFTLSVLAPEPGNTAPTAIDGTASGDEDIVILVDLADLIADAEDGEPVVTAASSVDGAVAINGTILTFTPAAEFSGEAVIAYTVQDAAGATAEAQVTVQVAAVDDAPVLALSPIAVAENVSGATVADIAITDPDTVYGIADVALSGPDAGLFRVIGTPGALQLALAEGVALDFEAATQPSVTLEIAGVQSNFTPAPSDVDETPSPALIAQQLIQAELGLITLSPTNGDATTTIAAIQGSGGEASGSGKILDQYGLRAGYSGNGYIDFGNDPGDTVAYSFTVAEAGSYDLHVRYSSQDTSNAPRPLDFGVNGAVTSTIFPSTGPSSGTAATQGFNNWGILTLTVTLAAGENAITLAIPAGKTAGPNIDSLALTSFGAEPNFEPPAFTSAAEFTIQEGETQIGVIAANDLDDNTTDGIAPDVPTYAIAGGVDEAAFQIDATTGALSLRDPADFEAKSSYEVTVSATDAEGGISLQTVTVTVENDPSDDVSDPTGIILTAVPTAENVAGAIVADIAVIGSTNIYLAADLSLEGEDALLFELVDGPTGVQLKLIDGVALDFEAVRPAVTVALGALASEPFSPEVLDLNEAPSAPILSALNVAGDATIGSKVGQLSAVDPEGDAITYSVDDARFAVNAAGELLTAADLSDFAGQNITVNVTATDGTSSSSEAFILAVGMIDAPATAITLTAIAVDENAAGMVVADIAVTDPDSTYVAADLALSGADAGLFTIIDGPSGPQLALKPGQALDFEAAPVSVAVTLGALSSVSFSPIVLDVLEGGPVPVLFSAAAISAYGTQDRPIDGGAGIIISADQGSLTLDGNLWKRVALPDSYAITSQTKLTLEVQIGTILPEIIGVGVDGNNDPFDLATGRMFEIAGNQGAVGGTFVNLRGTPAVENLGGGRLMVTIDLSGRAGQTIDSLVFFSDDDQKSDGLGSATFSNVQLIDGEAGNVAPRVVGGGVADLAINERSFIEIDLPFIDTNGDPLVFSFTISDANGEDMTTAFGIAINDGVLSGQLGDAPPGVYTVTVTATDGTFSTSDAFVLTVNNVNEAPEVADAAFEPLFGAVGQDIAPINLADFTGVFSDRDGDTLQFTVEGLPIGLTLNSQGVIIGKPLEAGTGAFKIIATDPGGLRAELTLDLFIDAPSIGDVSIIEAESFTGAASATNFVSTGQAGASGDRIIRAASASTPSKITTDLSANGLVDGYYKVAMTFYDETDASASFSLSVGSTVLASGAAFDGAGVFTNPSLPRGDAGQTGNLKTVTFDEVVRVTAGTILTLSGQANLELLRTDKFTFTRVADAPRIGDVTVIEAERFTGVASATNFITTGLASASGSKIIQAVSAATPSKITTDLSVNGLADGYYTVAMTFYDETDGSASFSLSIGSTVLASGARFDGAGVFTNPSLPRGDAGQTGNLKTVTFNEVVHVTAGTILTLSGQANLELLRTDKFTFTRVEAPNTAPTAPSLDQALVAENDAGAVVGVLSAVDAEGDTISFSADPASAFEVVAGVLKLKPGISLDYEAGATVNVQVTATDSKGSTTTATLTVTVIDINESPAAPTIDGTGVTENSPGAIVGTLISADPEGGLITFTVDPTSDFEVVAGQLKLKDGVSLNFEAAAEAVVSITATDAAGNATTGEVAVAISDENEAPTLAEGAALAPLTIGFGEGAVVDLGPLGAMDEDAGQEPSYAIRGVEGAALPDGFTVGDDGVTLVVPATTPAGIYTIEIFATDGQLNSAPVQLTLTVGEGTPFQPIVLQAEAGLIALAAAPDSMRTQVRDASNPEGGSGTTGFQGLRPDFSGTGYVDYGNDAGDRLTFSFNVVAAGTYDLNIRYASNSLRPLDLSVNGGSASAIAFASTDPDGPATGTLEGFDNWVFLTRTVTLQAGSNTIALAIPAGAVTGPNIDRIEITEAGTGPIPPADTTADADGNLVLDGPPGSISGAQVESINFNVSGLDADIVKIELSFDGGTTRFDVTNIADADGDFTFDGSSLPFGATTATVIVTDAVGNQATDSLSFTIAAPAGSGDPIVIQAEDETQVTVLDTGTGNADRSLTREVNAANPDGFGNFRAGAVGDAYVDFGTDAGDAISINVNAPVAGTYTVTFRYANADGTGAARPLDLSVNGGTAATLPFAITGTGDPGWEAWTDLTVELDLVAGANTVNLAIPAGGVNGPNIDQITFVAKDIGGPVDPGDAQVFTQVIKINFEAPTSGNGGFNAPAGYVTPAGYESDTGAAYGSRGNGFTYGWVDVENDAVTGTPLAQPTGSPRYKNDVPTANDLQKTYLHFEYPGAPQTTNERAWEMEVANGTYQLTLSIGDTGGKYDSNYRINVEGKQFLTPFTPVALDGVAYGNTGEPAYDTALDGQGFRSTLYTAVVQVTDGRLTIDSIGGDNTEIQFLELNAIPDITPEDGRPADADYSTFIDPVAASLEDGQVPISIAEDGTVPLDIDPTSSFVVGVNLQAPGHRGPNINYVDGIKLVETLTGIEVAINVQITGGADSLTIKPLVDLKEFTSYTLKLEDVLDLGSVTDATAPLRQFQDLTTTFVTGEKTADVPREVAFIDTVQINGFADGAGGYTSVEFGPDGKLYVATITGMIHRFDVNADGTLNKASQETLFSDYFQQFAGSSPAAEAQGEGRRSIIGIAFDPEDPNTIWITDNWPVPRESKAFDTPEFSGQISKVTLGAGGSLENATVETYITGLPRSGGDHVTNSIEFRPNPDAGQEGQPNYLLYLTQGSNSAAGEKDNAWGFRPEKLLNAAVLEVDRSRDVSSGPFDVRTEPIALTDNPITDLPENQFNVDGTYPGSYNPFADGAVLKIYATGIRNAYDLVWHSNGHLYASANGTAAGGLSPDNPNTVQNEASNGSSPKQLDYFFDIQADGYYGHPNPRQGHYILNGGNPTSGVDKNEVGGNTYYAPGTLPEAEYDIDGAYSLGFNKSPNGATEYTGNAFGSNLKGAVLFAQFSTGDNVRYIQLDAAGNIIADEVLRRPGGDVIDEYIDPLDIIQNPLTGQLYLMTLNRGTGESKIILLTPAPGGVTADLTADEGGDLALTVIDASNASAVVFAVAGLDADITSLQVAFDGGVPTTVTLNGGRFTFDLSGKTGPVSAVLTVKDAAGNTAIDTASVTIGGAGSAVFIDASAFTVISTATGTDATLVRRIDVPASYEPTGGNDLNGDGLNDGYDGIGYLDPNGTAEAKATISFDAPAAGTYTFAFRMANGNATQTRPISFSANGETVAVTDTRTGAFTTWNDFPVVLTLTQGVNTITILQTGTGAPNIDSVLVTPLDVILPDITADEGGDLAIALVSADDPQNAVFQVSGADADLVTFEITLNDGVRTATITLGPDGRFTTDLSGLGDDVTVALTVADAAGNTADASVEFRLGDGGVANDGEAEIGGVTYVLYEAENAVLSGAVVITDAVDDRNAQGAGFVDFDGTTDQSITWTIEVGEDGTYGLDFLYALSTTKTARPLSLSVDGSAVATLPFPPNSGNAETDWGPQSTTLNLVAGVHTITVVAPGAVGPNIDQLRITKAPVGSTADVTADEGGDLALSVVDASDASAIVFAVAGLDADIQTISVSFDGGTTSQDVTLTGGTFTADLSSYAGIVTAVLTVGDDNANTATAEASLTLVPAVDNDGTEIVGGVTFVKYEAETATLGGDPAIVTTAVSPRNQSGGAFVDATTPGDDTITWTIQVATDGDYQVDILYALGAGKAARPMPLSLDGSVIQTLPFTANSNSAEDIWGPASTTVTLTAGVHTLSVSAPGGNGPNIDYLRIVQTPVASFDPTYAAIDASGRIELEATDGTTRTVDAQTAEFYFTVAADGVYAFDLAANAGAPNGAGLTVFLTALGGATVTIDDSAFPGVGDAGETTSYATLQAGVNYKVTVVSDQPGANALDYLDVRVAPGDENADIQVRSLDPAFLDNRLHFSFIENPAEADGSGNNREFKTTGQVEISNSGTAPLSVLDADLSGPFTLADPSVFDGLVLAAGQSIIVTVNFDRSAYTPPTGSAATIDGTSTVFEGALVLRTNDADSPIATIDLAGFWQRIPEGGNEPNVNEVWKIFGFGNVIENLSLRGGGENSTLSTNDVFSKTDETEVLSPYWRLADGVTEARITQIAAFHGPGGATLAIHNPGNKGAQVGFGSHAGDDNQQLLPNAGNNSAFQTRVFNNGTIPDNWVGNEVFGISVAGLSTDPRLNPAGPVSVPGTQQGHTVKMFQALDSNGAEIPNTYLVIMDYTGINYDYNDNLFVVEGVAPVGFGGNIVVSGLDDAAADDRLVFTNINNPANGSQLFRNEATLVLTNDGFAPVTVTGITIGGANAGDFQIIGALPTLAAGQSGNVTVRFVGSDPADDDQAVLLKGDLTIQTDGFSQPGTIQLAGLAQFQSEGGEEPSVAQIAEAFGYGTDMAQSQLANGGRVETVGDEVLLPYLERLDGSAPIEVIQLAAFLNQGNVARLSLHGLGDDGLTQLFAADDQQGQTILPDGLVPGTGDTGSVARSTINSSTPFGLKVTVDGRPTYASWTDPSANRIDPNFGQLVPDDRGHLIRFFQAKDAAGNVIEGTYIGIQDYPGAGNYDYNDHMFVIKNVKAHVLTATEDANADNINDALQLDNDNDGTVNFFDDTPGSAGQLDRGDYVVGFNVGGPAVASQQGLGGVALRGDTDPLISYTGDGATRAPGQDLATNPNGANAVPGAFKTYRDGKNWTVEVGGLVDGEYIVVLHTQETYWNLPGRRQFDVSIDGVKVADDIDPFKVGGADTNVEIEARVQVTGGKFTVVLDSLGTDGIDNAALNAITVYQSAGNPGGGLIPDNAAPIAAAIAPQAAVEGQAFTLDVSGFFSDPDGDALSFSQSGLPAGLTLSAAGLLSGVATADGAFNILITASDGIASATGSFTLSVAPEPVPTQTPFPGPAAPVVAAAGLTIDASNYDNGGQGIAYNDNPGLDGGTNGGRAGSAVEQTAGGDIGWIANGEWLEYTVNISQAGTYDLDLALATTGSGRSVTVDFFRAGEATPYASTGSVANASTGSFTTFQPRSFDGVALEAGTQVVRVTFAGGSQDFRSFTLAPENANAAPLANLFEASDLTGAPTESFAFMAPPDSMQDASVPGTETGDPTTPLLPEFTGLGVDEVWA